MCSEYTYVEKCNLFVLIYNKNSDVFFKDFGGMKKEKQVCWHDHTWSDSTSSVCLKCLCNEIFMLKKITLMWSLRLLISIVKVLERIIERKYVCLTFEKRDFTQKIETYFIPQLMTSSRSSTWIFIVIEKTVQNAV